MLVTWQTVITAAAVVAAVMALFRSYNKGYDFVKHQAEQDKVIKDIQEEQQVLVTGMLACLKGISQLGANGPVTEAIASLEQHMIKKTHGG